MFVLTKQLHYISGEASGYGTMPHPVVIDGCQQGDKHVRQPQVHFVGQSINSRRLIQPDRQCFPNLLLLYAPLTPSRFSRRKAREVGKIGVELSRTQSGLPGEKLQEILPELPTDGFVWCRVCWHWFWCWFFFCGSCYWKQFRGGWWTQRREGVRPQKTFLGESLVGLWSCYSWYLVRASLWWLEV